MMYITTYIVYIGYNTYMDTLYRPQLEGCLENLWYQHRKLLSINYFYTDLIHQERCGPMMTSLMVGGLYAMFCSGQDYGGVDLVSLYQCCCARAPGNCLAPSPPSDQNLQTTTL